MLLTTAIFLIDKTERYFYKIIKRTIGDNKALKPLIWADYSL